MCVHWSQTKVDARVQTSSERQYVSSSAHTNETRQQRLLLNGAAVGQTPERHRITLHTLKQLTK